MGFYRRSLPHLFIPGYPLFVTVRLNKSIPRQELNDLHTFFLNQKKAIQKESNISIKKLEAELQRQFFKKYDSLLHQNCMGPHWLINDSIAEVVSESLHWGNGDRYHLISFTIMPNHVHIVLKPIVREKEKMEKRGKKGEVTYMLADIMESFKKYTARKANEILKRSGRFWQHESYDHLLRNKTELKRAIRYTLHDAVRAKYVLNWQDYKWSYWNGQYEI